MEFTDNFSGNLLNISPCGSLIAHLEGEEVLVRDFGSLIIVMRGTLMNAPVRALEWSSDSQCIAAQYDRAVQVWKFERQSDLANPLTPNCTVTDVFVIERIILHAPYLLVFSELELHVRVWRLGEKQPIGILPGSSVLAMRNGRLALYHPATSSIALYDIARMEKPLRTFVAEEPVQGLDIYEGSVIGWTNRIHLQVVCYDENGKACYYRPTADTFGLVASESTPRFLAFLDARDCLHVFNKETRTFFRSANLSLAQAKQQSSLVFYKEIQTGKYEAQYANYISYTSLF